jgi:hypothetical protein
VIFGWLHCDRRAECRSWNCRKHRDLASGKPTWYKYERTCAVLDTYVIIADGVLSIKGSRGWMWSSIAAYCHIRDGAGFHVEEDLHPPGWVETCDICALASVVYNR